MAICAGLVLSGAVAHAHDDGPRKAQAPASTARGEVWRAPGAWGDKGTVRVQLLGLNDLHGRLLPGLEAEHRPVGGAAVLASYLRHEESTFAGTSFIVHAGDVVGASPPESALLQDEPTIAFLNLLANDACKQSHGRSAHCNMVGTLGNHEFDEGQAELLRLLRGGKHAQGAFLSARHPGVTFPYVSANVLGARDKHNILPPYVVRTAEGENIAFLGATLEAAPTVITPEGRRGIAFVDEAEAINRHVKALQKRGIESFVVLIHQGGHQTPYEGLTRADGVLSDPEIGEVVSRLDGAVDVVVSGHAHAFTNTLLPNAAGKPTLVTQAFSSGTAFGDIELTIDRATHDIVEKSASIVRTFNDAGPGLTPAKDVAELVEAARARVAPLVERKVGESAVSFARAPNDAGESAMGDLIADAQREAVGADVAIMNLGGVRADLDAGPITWGELFTVQPFANNVVRMELTGAELLSLLEQQFSGEKTRVLQISGMRERWDPRAPDGKHIVGVEVNGTQLAPERVYTLAVNSFLAPGGDGFTVLAQGRNRLIGPVDLEALTRHVEAAAAPLTRSTEPRITLATLPNSAK